MRKMINSIQKYLWPVVYLIGNVGTLAGQTAYTITLDVDNAGLRTYVHTTSVPGGNINGNNGNQLASSLRKDTIQWQCANACTALHVLFKRDTPCRNGNNKINDLYDPNNPGTSLVCKVGAGAGSSTFLVSFGYNIAVYWSAKPPPSPPPSGLLLEDPDVIVDNGISIENRLVKQKVGAQKSPQKETPKKPEAQKKQ